jgi:hypothetical protein
MSLVQGRDGDGETLGDKGIKPQRPGKPARQVGVKDVARQGGLRLQQVEIHRLGQGHDLAPGHARGGIRVGEAEGASHGRGEDKGRRGDIFALGVEVREARFLHRLRQLALRHIADHHQPPALGTVGLGVKGPSVVIGQRPDLVGRPDDRGGNGIALVKEGLHLLGRLRIGVVGHAPVIFPQDDVALGLGHIARQVDRVKHHLQPPQHVGQIPGRAGEPVTDGIVIGPGVAVAILGAGARPDIGQPGEVFGIMGDRHRPTAARKDKVHAGRRQTACRDTEGR